MSDATVQRIKAAISTNQVVVIDDSIAEKGDSGIALTDWIEVVEVLKEGNAGVVQELRDVFQNAGLERLEVEPTTEILPQIRDIVQKSKVARAIALCAEKRSSEPEVEAILKYLGHLDLNVTAFRSAVAAPTDASLVFLDFTINEDQAEAGTAAKEYLKLVKDRAETTDRLPAVILMSRNAPLRSAWEEVAEASSYLRFCFRYQEKSVLASSSEVFEFHLDELLEAWPLGQVYLRHLKALSKSLNESVALVTKDLMRLTPAEFNGFANLRLKDAEGDKKGASHLRFLISRLLEAELRRSTGIVASLAEFGHTLSATPVRHMDPNSLALHDLQGRILYDTTASAKNSPVGFGDIFC